MSVTEIIKAGQEINNSYGKKSKVCSSFFLTAIADLQGLRLVG